MAYTYYTRDLEKAREALGGFAPFVFWTMVDEAGRMDERFGGRVCGAAVFDRALSPEELLALGLKPGIMPSVRAIETALDWGAIYPAFHDGLLCVCANLETDAGINVVAMSIPGELRSVSQFWKNGPEGAALTVRAMLEEYLPDDDLAPRVLAIMNRIGRDRVVIDLHSKTLAARMAEASVSPALALLSI